MTVTLTVWQRVMLARAIGLMRGNLAQLRAAGKVMDVLELTESEREEAKYVELPNGNVTWASAASYDVELDEAALRLVKDAFAKYPSWQFGDAKVEELAEVLGVSE